MHLAPKSRDERNAARIARMRGEGMPHAAMRPAMAPDPEEVDTAAGPVKPGRAWPKVSARVRGSKGSELDLHRLLGGLIPGLDALLSTEPEAWSPAQCGRAGKVVVIVLRADPGVLDEEQEG